MREGRQAIIRTYRYAGRSCARPFYLIDWFYFLASISGPAARARGLVASLGAAAHSFLIASGNGGGDNSGAGAGAGKQGNKTVEGTERREMDVLSEAMGSTEVSDDGWQLTAEFCLAFFLTFNT